MLGHAQAWAWYFDRHPQALANWGHQNGYWPMHLATCIDYPDKDGEYADRGHEYSGCIPSCQCWCHLDEAQPVVSHP